MVIEKEKEKASSFRDSKKKGWGGGDCSITNQE